MYQFSHNPDFENSFTVIRVSDKFSLQLYLKKYIYSVGT